jgi:putative nucleotidyltransferase with HDIG domain
LTKFSRRIFSKLDGLAVEAYAVTLGVGAAAFAIGLIESRHGLEASPAIIVLMGGVAAFMERQPVRVSPSVEMTVSVLPVLFAAVEYGPLAGMAVAAIGLVPFFERPYFRWLIWTSSRSLAGGLGGLAAGSIGVQTDSIGLLIAAVIAAATTEAVVDMAAGAGVYVLRRHGTFGSHVRTLGPVFLATVPLYAPVLVLLVYAYVAVSPWSVLLFFGPAFAAQRFYRLYQEQREATQQLGVVNVRLEQANVSFATALVATLDARDRYTAGHSAAVAIYARDIAERMGLTEQEQRMAHLAGLVHDIGKIGLPAGLLEKPGALTLEERRHMEEHSVIGERILRNVEDYAEIADIVRHHHERVDGMGYPDKLADYEIPLISRIIAVADAYDAMTSDRPYRDAMPSRVARLRLAQAVESQFDTSVVAAFEAILAGASETYRVAGTPAFSLIVQQEAYSELSAEVA